MKLRDPRRALPRSRQGGRRHQRSSRRAGTSRTSIQRGRTYKKRYRFEFHDPTGAEHGGIPTYGWRMAPDGLATKRQLLALGLTRGRQPLAAQVIWMRAGKETIAYLYRIDKAVPKRPVTLPQIIALTKALEARRICPQCKQDAGYTIPTSIGRCLICHGLDVAA